MAGSIKNYLPTIIPGILIQTLVTSTGTVGTNLSEDTDKSISNRLQSMPISRMAPLVGILTADLVRYAVAGIVVFSMGYILGFKPKAGLGAVIGSILFMMIIAWCLSWLFSFLAMSVKSVTASSTTAMLIMFPLSFLSNAFVPTNTLPSALKFFANHINPVSYAVSAVRHILSTGTIDGNFWGAFVATAILLVILVH
nr:ABC transporter permease [Lactococcus lactis]